MFTYATQNPDKSVTSSGWVLVPGGLMFNRLHYSEEQQSGKLQWGFRVQFIGNNLESLIGRRFGETRTTLNFLQDVDKLYLDLNEIEIEPQSFNTYMEAWGTQDKANIKAAMAALKFRLKGQFEWVYPSQVQ